MQDMHVLNLQVCCVPVLELLTATLPNGYIPVWSNTQKSLYIELLLLNIPTSAIYIDRTKGSWQVLNGKEQVEAVRSFVFNEYALKGLVFMPEYEGVTNVMLDTQDQMALLKRKITVSFIEAGTDEDTKKKMLSLFDDTLGIFQL